MNNIIQHDYKKIDKHIYDIFNKIKFGNFENKNKKNELIDNLFKLFIQKPTSGNKMFVGNLMKQRIIYGDLAVKNLKNIFDKHDASLHKFYLQSCFKPKKGDELLNDKHWSEIFNLMLSIDLNQFNLKDGYIHNKEIRPYRLYQLCEYSSKDMINKQIKKVIFDTYQDYFMNYCMFHPVDRHREFVKKYITFVDVLNDEWRDTMNLLLKDFIYRNDLIELLIGSNIDDELKNKLKSLKTIKKLMESK
ncbi:MAG: hypothetical protein ACOCP8_01440 [archaeon]